MCVYVRVIPTDVSSHLNDFSKAFYNIDAIS